MYQPIMKCGCAAAATCRDDGKGNHYDPPIPVCITHDCLEIADPQPDLEGRKARCVYFGVVPTGRNHESNYGCKRGEPCQCEQPSLIHKLPFFVHRPDRPHDEFYCGCFGWD